MKKLIFTLVVFFAIVSTNQSFAIGFPHNLLAPNKHEKKDKVSKKALGLSKKVVTSKDRSKVASMSKQVLGWFCSKEA